MPHAPCPPRHPSIRPVRSHSLPVERLLPGSLRHPSLPGVSLFRCFRCYLNPPPAMHGPQRHPPPPGVSLFRRFRCNLDRPPTPHGSLRYPSLPGVSRFRQIGSHLHRVALAPGPALWLPAPDAPPIGTSPAHLIARTCPSSLRNTARPLAEQGLPLRIPSGSVKDTTAGQRSGRGRHDRRGLAGCVGHEHTAQRALQGLPP